MLIQRLFCVGFHSKVIRVNKVAENRSIKSEYVYTPHLFINNSNNRKRFGDKET